MTFSDILIKSFSENLKILTTITKSNHFSIFFFFFIAFLTKTIGF